MSHRVHLFSLRIAHALRDTLNEAPYGLTTFTKDLMAGITVGVIAIPLAMALAIAIGVAPQYGLYTAIIGGFFIPLTGGSRYSVSGPTAAFVVILYPVVQQYGIAGLLIASILAGIILVMMALLRMGRYIEYIPEPVTLGFTGGIAVVIATLQVKDFFGLTITAMPENFTGKIMVLTEALPDFSLWPLIVGLVTLTVMMLWPRLKTSIPAHLPAVVVGSLIAFTFNRQGLDVATIGSTFTFTLSDGTLGSGIPSVLPNFQWPWLRTQANEAVLVLSWQLAQDLLSAAFAIAMLGAIESLLCAVVLDGMSGKKHSANSELLGQGIGNIITPFFGGITATAAIARSAVNFKTGAKTPIAAMVHAIVVFISLVSLSSVLAYLPMASMAALLIMVAWNMSEAPKAMHLLAKAPRSEIFVFMVCFSLTVLFDMVIAITTGIVLASLLFMKQIAEMTKIQDITEHNKLVNLEVPDGWKVFKINGPLFFAAADRVFGELSQLCNKEQGVVLYLDGVSILDSGGVAALNKFIDKCGKSDTYIYLADFQFQPLKTLAKSGFRPDGVICETYSTLSAALNALPASRVK
ncbi:C4-dicarboxylic acid transporter DauA [Glaciecola sp. 33A]|jgi:SulP family sulfate permease|uniref:C4-dicarboxylic acid transporter DauA n=1 Tax=Glaciecola sp. 33A TaxID=2057807 RepID=UPI000C32C5AA|nr:C4-dicarboxylic acid transporter DauA [Glaciecola sp. 33A]PKI03502.1 C4-dicarboxylic acid transporter DauA [Glaciecola sp. 33A]